MPNSSNETLKNSGKLILVYLGTWITSAFFIIMGSKYTIFSTVTLGIFHGFLGCLMLLIIIQKLGSFLTKRTEIPDDETEEYYYDDDTSIEDDNEIIEEEMDDDQDFESVEIDETEHNPSVLFPIFLLLISIGAIVVQIVLLNSFASTTELYKPPIWIGILQILFSFAYLMLVQWFFSKSLEYDEYKMFGYICRAGQVISFVTGVSVLLRALNIYQLESIFVYVIAIFCIIIYIDFIISCFLKIFEFDFNNIKIIKLNILIAIFGSKDTDASIIDVIEEKIGVSLRSAWTVKFVRKLIPIILIIIVVTLWGMTAFVTIDTQSEGILYRFGRIISEEPLAPGLHVKLPWPIDDVKSYPVNKTKYLTVGYSTGQDKGYQYQNYLWTSVHEEEYKLLLGDGKELVSINMTVHYKINNLTDYVKNHSIPEDVLLAKAYEKMLKLIVASNLDGLLSKDRASLASTVKSELQDIINNEKCGLEITDVAITSIHPPVEIATSYQELVSADIQKQVIISEALTESEQAIPAAEQEKSETIRDAMIDYNQRHGESVSEATQTTSSIEAYNYYTEAYRLRKWLSAMTEYLKSNYFYVIDEEIVDGDGEIWMNNGLGY